MRNPVLAEFLIALQFPNRLSIQSTRKGKKERYVNDQIMALFGLTPTDNTVIIPP